VREEAGGRREGRRKGEMVWEEREGEEGRGELNKGKR